MAGMNRKAVVKDNLAGAVAQPVTIQSGGFNTPAPIVRQPDRFTDQVNKQLNGFLQGKLKEAVSLKQDRDYMDGQMAFQQGKAFDDVKMDGNKWALEGYRVVQAQTVSSSMLTAQEHDITTGANEMSPDSYREQFVNRASELVKTAPDGRTGELIREQLMRQMPVLVRNHTKAHLEWQEKTNFTNLEQSIDMISRDVTSDNQLVSFASGKQTRTGRPLHKEGNDWFSEKTVTVPVRGKWVTFPSVLTKDGTTVSEDEVISYINNNGPLDPITGEKFPSFSNKQDAIDYAKERSKTLIEDSASGGLSDSRRRAAVVSGTVRAFDNDNPLAYATLSKAGTFNDSLTSQQANSLRAARKRFESRRRTEYNEDLFNAEQDLMKRVSNGELSPTDAVEAVSTLYTDHNIEMTKSELGAWYHKAEDGTRTRKITQAALLQDASLRGDQNAVADVIINSLAGTESSGDFSATRTNNDGRTFSGRLQFGQARLDDFAKVLTGGKRKITLSDFRKDKNLQRMAERWHVNDILRTIKQKGYDKLVGKSIGGTPVTTSGLVAIAHLGGKGGLNKFIETNGKHNPADQLGTTLKDYLKKHAGLNEQEMFTPEQRMVQARKRLETTRKAVAMDAYEIYAPLAGELDTAFERGQLTEAQWKKQRSALAATYGQEHTKASVNEEINLSRKVSDNLLKVLQDQSDKATKTATEKRQAENELAAGTALQAANQQFGDIVTAWETGKPVTINGKQYPVSEKDVRAAQAMFKKTRAGITEQYDVPLNVDKELSARQGVANQLTQAIKRRNQFDTNTALIKEAVNSGTLDQLSSPLQQRAIDEFKQTTMNEHTNAISAGDLTMAEADAGINQTIMTHLGTSGLVDATTKRVMNGFLQQEWIVGGQPNPNVISAIGDIRTITAANPAMLEKYIPDDDTRAMVQTAINRAGGGDLANAVFVTRDNTNKASQLKDKAGELNLDNVEKSLRIWSLNQANDTQVQVWGDVFQPSAEYGGSDFSNETGVLGALFSDRSDVSQLFDRSTVQFNRLLDPEGDAQTMLRSSVKAEARQLMLENSGIMSIEEAIVQAQQTVQTRGGFIGGDFVLFPKGESLLNTMFGSKAKDIDVVDATNRAIMDYIRRPDMLANHPSIAKAMEKVTFDTPTFVDGAFDMGGFSVNHFSTTDFKTSMVPTKNGTAIGLYFKDELGGYTNHVLLSQKDLRRAGMNLINKLNN